MSCDPASRRQQVEDSFRSQCKLSDVNVVTFFEIPCPPHEMSIESNRMTKHACSAENALTFVCSLQTGWSALEQRLDLAPNKH